MKNKKILHTFNNTLRLLVQDGYAYCNNCCASLPEKSFYKKDLKNEGWKWCKDCQKKDPRKYKVLDKAIKAEG